jgi:RNA polymerase sigma factor (sigma-70 family)
MSGTDLHLLTLWHQNGDADAFKELTIRYGGMVFAVCRRVLRDPSAAEDVTQECFEKLATNPKMPTGNLGAWLHRVATNRALDRIKSQNRRSAREQKYSDERVEKVTTTVVWNDIYDSIDEAINDLPDKIREPMVQHFFENRTHSQIANGLGVSRKTVAYRVDKGIVSIRKTLRKRGIEVSSSALAALLAENLASGGAISAALGISLTKIAMSGVNSAAAVGGTTMGGGALVATFAAIVLATFGGLTIWDPLKTEDSPPTFNVGNPTGLNTASNGTNTGVRSARSVETVSGRSRTAESPVANASSVPDESAIAEEVGDVVITGKVSDRATGRGLSGIDVYAFLDDGSNTYSYRNRDAFPTDKNGIYRITGLEAGRYKISCQIHISALDDQTQRRYQLAYSMGRPLKMHRVILEENKKIVGIDFSINLGTTIRGRVSHEGISRFSAQSKRNRKIHISSSILPHSCYDDGQFIIGGIQPGSEIYLYATAPGYASAPYRVPSIPEEGASGIELMLMPEGSISGILIDEWGKPLAKKSILARSEFPGYALSHNKSTNERGEFSLRGLYEGSYEIRVAPPEKMSGGISLTNSVLLKKIDIHWGESIRNVSLTAATTTPPPIDRISLLRGTVTDTLGNPIPDTKIRAYTRTNSKDEYKTVTDAKGMFVLKDVNRTTDRIEVNHPEFSHASRLEQRVEPGESIDFVLKKLSSITGRVIDAESGKPLPRFEIGRSMYRTIKNDNGEFTIDHVDAGTPTIRIRADGYLDHREAIFVEPGTTKDGVVIALRRGDYLTGIVVDKFNKPVSGASIYFDRILASNLLTRTNENGRFLSNSAPVDVDKIVAYDATAGTGWGARTIDRTALNIQLEKNGRLSGTISIAGEPVANSEIVMTGSGAFRMNPKLRGRSNSSGEFEVNGATPGEYSVLCWIDKADSGLAHHRSVSRLVQIDSDATTEIRFDFPSAAGTIEGVVTAQGRPIANASVKVTVEGSAGLETRTTKTSETGQYLIQDLPEGVAQLTTRASSKGIGIPNETVDLFLENNAAEIRDIEFLGAGILVGKILTGKADAGNIKVRVVPDRHPIEWEGEYTEEEFLRIDPDVVGVGFVREDGSFRIEGLEPGNYKVVARTMRGAGDTLVIRAFTSSLFDVGSSGESYMELDLR